MKFSDNKPIYKQISEYFYTNILKKKWQVDDRLPSVRELAVLMEVNPNTAMRAFHELQEQEVIYNQRGVGYFLSESGYERVKSIKKEEFIQQKLPAFIDDMNLLGITMEEFEWLYKKNDSIKN